VNVPVPVPKPEGLSFSDFTEFLYTAFFIARFPPGVPGRVQALEPLLFENASPGVRAAWKAAAETALRLAPQVRTADLPVGPNAMYQQTR
jgi:hypothetical protein